MKGRKSYFQAAYLGLLFYFLIPYLVFIKYFNLDFNLDYSEIAWAFKNSVTQSLSASFLVTLLSIPLSWGLFSLSAAGQTIFSRLLLIPQIFPSLFSILIAFSILNPFPMGSLGIIFIFVLVNLGFSTVLLYSATQEKMGGHSLQSQILGLSRFTFFSRIYLPLMRSDLWIHFVMVFIFCMTSFAVPLVAGGGRGTNLEVLIYEKIFINQNWAAAWTLNLFQTFFIFALSFLFLKNIHFNKSEFESGKYLKSKWGFYGILAYLIIYLGGYALGLVQSFSGFELLSTYSNEIMKSTLRSLQMLSVYVVVCFVLLILWIYDFIQRGQHHSVRHLLAPSTILVSFSFYLLFSASEQSDYLKMVLAMSILFYPSLFKSFLERPLDQIKSQIQVAQICGLSNLQIITKIILKQIQKPLFIWVSFLVIWFLSDFAVTKSLGIQKSTVGLMAENFMSSYRLSQAYLLSFYILILWGAVLAIIYFIAKALGVVRVTDQKS